MNPESIAANVATAASVAARSTRGEDRSLIVAVSDNRIEEARKAIQQGANPNALSDNKRSALFFAKSPEMVSFLLSVGADPHHKDKFGNPVTKSPHSGQFIRDALEKKKLVAVMGDTRFVGPSSAAPPPELPSEVKRKIASYLGGKRKRTRRPRRRHSRTRRRNL
jgi:hypothetical protein